MSIKTYPEAPYYDDYNEDKDYVQVLAVAGNYAQSREFSQIGTIARSQIEKLGNSVYYNGEIISGMNIVVSQRDTESNAGEVTIGTGEIFLEGLVREIKKPMVATFNGVGDEIIVIYINESVVTAVQDPSLRNPAVGSSGYNTEGASRIKQTVAVKTILASEYDGTGVKLVELTNGSVMSVGTVTSESRIVDKKSQEVFGNTKIEGLNLRGVRQHSSYDSGGDFMPNFYYSIEAGRGLIGGKPVELGSKHVYNLTKSNFQSYITTTTKFHYVDSETDAYKEHGRYLENDIHDGPTQYSCLKTIKFTYKDNSYSIAISSGETQPAGPKNGSGKFLDRVLKVDGVFHNDLVTPYTEGADYTVSMNPLGYVESITWIGPDPDEATVVLAETLEIDTSKNPTGYVGQYTPNFVQVVNHEIKWNTVSATFPSEECDITITYEYLAYKYVLVYLDTNAEPRLFFGGACEENQVLLPEVDDSSLLLIGYIRFIPDNTILVFDHFSNKSIYDEIMEQEMYINSRECPYCSRIVGGIDDVNVGAVVVDTLADMKNIHFDSTERFNTVATIDVKNSIVSMPSTVSQTVLRPSSGGVNWTDCGDRIEAKHNGENTYISQMIATSGYKINNANDNIDTGVVEVYPSIAPYTHHLKINGFDTQVSQVSDWWDTFKTEGYRGDEIEGYGTISSRIHLKNFSPNEVVKITIGQKMKRNTMVTPSYWELQEVLVPATDINTIDTSVYLGSDSESMPGYFISYKGSLTSPSPAVRFVDGSMSSTFIRYLTTDENGEAEALIKASLLDLEIPSGMVSIKAIGTNTEAEFVYNAKLESKKSTDDVKKFQYDPKVQNSLCQTFAVTDIFSDSSLKYVTVSSVDLYFKKKPTTSSTGVVVQLRDTDYEGMPGSHVLAEATIPYGNINASSQEPISTHVEFNSVFLKPNYEYSILIKANSEDYELWTARSGETDVVSGKQITTDIYPMGVLYSSDANGTWTEIRDTDITFKLNRQLFNASGVFFVQYNLVNTSDFDKIAILADVDNKLGAPVEFQLYDETPGVLDWDTVDPGTYVYTEGKKYTMLQIIYVPDDWTDTYSPAIMNETVVLVGHSIMGNGLQYISEPCAICGCNRLRVSFEMQSEYGVPGVFHGVAWDSTQEITIGSRKTRNMGDGWTQYQFTGSFAEDSSPVERYFGIENRNTYGKECSIRNIRAVWYHES